MIRPPTVLAALLVVTTAATLALGTPARGDPGSTGASPTVPSDLEAEYPLRDQKECCAAPPTPSAGTGNAPLRGADGEGGGGVAPWAWLLIALSGCTALVFLLRTRQTPFARFDASRLTARAVAIPRRIRRIDLTPVAAAASAVPRAIRRIDLSATTRRDRSVDQRSADAEIAARRDEPSCIAERIEQRHDEPEAPRGEDRPTRVEDPPPPRTTRVPDGPVHAVAPQTFGEAPELAVEEEIADGFEYAVTVILDLRATEPKLADRLTELAADLASELGGTIEEVTRNLLLIIPPDARISADQAARLRDPGRFEP
jgi:FtsZ-interacting cell division protein YlmF